MQFFVVTIFNWLVSLTSKIVLWFFQPFLDMLSNYQTYKLGDFWHNIVMFSPILSRLALLLTVVILFAKIFSENVNHYELGSFTNRMIFFIVLIVTFSAMGLNMVDDVIFLILGILAYRWSGDLLRAVKIWRY